MRFLPAAYAAFFMFTVHAHADGGRIAFVASALAQTQVEPAVPVTPAPVPVPVIVQASPPPVTIPVGEILSGLLGYVWVALGGLIAYALRKLPPQLNALAMTMRVDQLLKQAIAFGINSTPGAVEGLKLEINIANPVLRAALSYAAQHGSSLVKQFAGSHADLAEKIWSRLHLAPDVATPDFNKMVPDVDIYSPRKAA